MFWLRTTKWDREIEALDAVEDAQDIVILLVNHVFPLEIVLALELAQLRTFTIPSISRILHATREYEAEGVKRLDDTRALIGEIFKSPRGSTEQQEMIAHLNAIHGLYKIKNDDYLYTLSTFIFDPILFIDRFGFRKLTEKERDAMFEMYRALGVEMGIENLPASRAAMWEWRVEYERRAQRYSPDNAAVAQGLLSAVRSLTPKPFQGQVERVTAALIDDPKVLAALGMDEAPRWLRRAVRQSMAVQKIALRRVNIFESKGIVDWPLFSGFPSYPNGYERLKLGPRRVIEILERRRAAHVA